MERPTKITFGEMRASDVRGVVVYCADYKCSHSVTISADKWPDDVRLSDIEGQFGCTRCGNAARTCGRTSIGISDRRGRWGIVEPSSSENLGIHERPPAAAETTMTATPKHRMVTGRTYHSGVFISASRAIGAANTGVD